jgi:hypothetical protein
LLGRITGGDPFAGLLSAVKAVVGRWRQPIGQNREGLPARFTDSTAHPNRIASVVVALTESASVADDRIVLADWTSPRQAVQWNHPRVDIVFGLWQCDKKNHGWREGRR